MLAIYFGIREQTLMMAALLGLAFSTLLLLFWKLCLLSGRLARRILDTYETPDDPTGWRRVQRRITVHGNY